MIPSLLVIEDYLTSNYLVREMLVQFLFTRVTLSLVKMLPNRPRRSTNHVWNRGGNLDKTRGGLVVLGSLVEEE